MTSSRCVVPGAAAPHNQRDPEVKAPPFCAGFLSPAIRGALLTALLVMYLLLAVAAGFASVWLWGIIHRSYEGWWVLRLALLHTHDKPSVPAGLQLAPVAWKCTLPLRTCSCQSDCAISRHQPHRLSCHASSHTLVSPVMSGCHMAAFSVPAPPQKCLPCVPLHAQPNFQLTI